MGVGTCCSIFVILLLLLGAGFGFVFLYRDSSYCRVYQKSCCDEAELACGQIPNICGEDAHNGDMCFDIGFNFEEFCPAICLVESSKRALAQ